MRAKEMWAVIDVADEDRGPVGPLHDQQDEAIQAAGFLTRTNIRSVKRIYVARRVRVEPV